MTALSARFAPVGRSAILLVTAWAFAASSIAAEPLRVAFFQGGEAPFMFPEGSDSTGIYRDILDRIAERSGLELEYFYYPFPRAQAMFDAGKLDLEPGANPAWRENAKVPGLFSKPFAQSVDILLFRPGKLREVKKAEDLAGETVGAINGYVYPFFGEAFASGQVLRDDAVNESGLLDKLTHGRNDQVILNEAIARWWLKRDPELAGYEVGDVIGRVDVMFRLHPSRKAALAAIDEALDAMIAEGEIEAIFAEYR